MSNIEVLREIINEASQVSNEDVVYGKLETLARKADALSDPYRKQLLLNGDEINALRQRAEAAEARLLALQVARSKSVKLRDETDNVLWTLKPADVPGAINWGDLGVREVQEVINEERCWWRVVIEEAGPSNSALHAAVMVGLAALGWDADDIELETAW